MKKVLILAYDFPPYISVGGLRPFSWYKYFPDFDIFPVVVTRQWNNKYGNHLDYVAESESTETIFEQTEKGLIIRTPYSPNLANKMLIKYGDSKYKLFRRGISAFFEFSQFFFEIGPKVNIFLSAEKYLEKNKVDIILVTGEPYILFHYASKLSKKFNIPWIADYRDPWTQDKSRKNKGFSVKWDAFLEKRTLKNVSAITTVSEFFEKQISTLVKNKPFYIIQNGYDEEAVENVKNIEQSSDSLSIAVVGTIYKWHPIESFLKVCSEFVNEHTEIPKFRINFYGVNIKKEIEELIGSKYQNLKNIAVIHPKVSNEIFLEKLAQDNVFLLFNQYTTVGTKIYNFLALKRQIILCYSNDENAKELKKNSYFLDESGYEGDDPQMQIIEETDSGTVIEDENHLKIKLNEFYQEFKAKGFISCNSIKSEKYSRKLQARKLVEIMNGILEKHQ